MSILQLKASDPTLSTWVSASAGTGKTKILTDRVLRLLLQNVPFNKILCLTFTNAAANEMQERIIAQFQKWSHSSQEDLLDSLQNTLGRKPTKDELIKASSLFELYLKTQDQINIYTIHSFCQKILKKFPLEAGISPHFKIIDEFKVNKIIRDIKRQIFNLPEIQHVINFLIENFHELTIDDIFNEIISVKTKILTKKLTSLSAESNPELSGLECINNLAKHDPNISIEVISNSDIKNLILDSLGADLASKDIKPFFLTLSGEKKKRIVTKKIASPGSDLYEELEKIQDQIYQLDQVKKTENLLLNSKLFEILAEKLILEFESYKTKNAFLDYDDLILHTQSLLTNSTAKEWVLYKLDGGIEHLLVDEAQDTSNSQWRIIEALAQEFYSGESGNNKSRTIFVVGDEKQSIFSFQGADISAFSYMNKFLNDKLKEGKKAFETIDLNVSYRSTKEILTCVKDVFNKIAKNSPEDFKANLPEMIPYRNAHNGLVQLWPLCSNEGGDAADEFWPICPENTQNNSKVILAKKIANYVKEQISSGRILPSTNNKISPQDFMILFRSRDDFTDEVIKALKEAKIDITGLNRISLADDLAVADLIAIAKFVLNPENDLNLATLIKSPILDLSEQELYKLVIAARANKLSLWEYIKLSEQYSLIKDKLEEFLALYRSFPLNNFFPYITDVMDYRNIMNKNDEAIDEFLKLSNDYFLEYGNSLQNFIYWFVKTPITVKRDTESLNKLRIMTVHGSKGLQAPIVILCDTTKLPTMSDRFIWDENDQLLSAKSSSYIPEFYEGIKAKEQHKAYQEYLRLLYVGMTRAEDHLIICGYQGNSKIPENCWYELIKKSLQEIGSLEANGILLYGDSSLVSSSQKPSLCLAENKKADQGIINPPTPWKLNKTVRLSYTNIETDTSYKNTDLLEYGLVFHKILEEAMRNRNLSSIFNHPLITTLESSLQKRIKTSLEKIAINEEFNELSKYDLKTELSFGYKTDSEIKIGRVDLLVIQKERIIIIDYKSGKSSKGLIPDTYIKQLRFYKQAFREIYPDKIIDCKIIWLDSGTIVNVAA
ncbi:MAG: UvrD-helicase domain-containing protein [Rickettsiales bacterium]|nr:UvrD-helicase domain-containing protein [Rickettsiales bacterium]